MNATTFIHRKVQMKREPLPECHGGKGALDWTEVLAPEQLKGRRLKFVHDDILAPGVSIGVHPHRDDEEYYYIISGRGVLTLDGKEYEVKTGDITGIARGGTHGLRNDSDEELRILVFCISR